VYVTPATVANAEPWIPHKTENADDASPHRVSWPSADLPGAGAGMRIAPYDRGVLDSVWNNGHGVVSERGEKLCRWASRPLAYARGDIVSTSDAFLGSH